MCALFGWLDYQGNISAKVLQKLTQALANSAEERGTDASGISYVKDGHITIYKRPKPSHKMKFCVPFGTTAVMGHTRLTTQGSQKKNYNNHPFRGFAGMEFAFAHNGVLYNDRELRRQKQLPATKIETDSYIGVQLLEQNGNLSFESLAQMAEDVSGNFTFTLLDAENTLYFVKGSSPLYLVHFPQLGLYAYASTQSIMEKALKSCGLHRVDYEVLNVKNGEILKIDRFGNLSVDTFQTNFYDPFFRDYMLWEDENESDEALETLLLMCRCFGVTEEEVLELLEMGYSYDEIEWILNEPRVMRKTL
ncbi:MAG: class II glutamine amidotransferase [Oscillospiraceae bacterium]|nr:class II glutamine amidotransferase [Oscillospiraceae bacterium]